jgi:hypothetical protein
MIGFIGTSITITIKYDSSQSMTGSKTRSIPYWTVSVFSSTVTDLVLIYESVVSYAAADLNDKCLTNESFSVESYVMTDGQSASLSWNEASNWDLRPDSYYC